MSHAPPPTLVGLVDDHAKFRDVLGEVVEGMPEMRVVWEARNADEAMQSMSVEPPGLLIVDLSLPGVSGIELIRRVAARWPGTATLVVSGHVEQAYVNEAVRVGARAYVVKGRPTELREGIRAVLGGDTYLSPSVRAPDPSE